MKRMKSSTSKHLILSGLAAAVVQSAPGAVWAVTADGINEQTLNCMYDAKCAPSGAETGAVSAELQGLKDRAKLAASGRSASADGAAGVPSTGAVKFQGQEEGILGKIGTGARTGLALAAGALGAAVGFSIGAVILAGGIAVTAVTLGLPLLDAWDDWQASEEVATVASAPITWAARIAKAAYHGVVDH